MLADIFTINMSPLELIIRGTSVYWFIFVAYRYFLRRGAGQIGFADIMLLVLIADASSLALSGAYETITEGFILISTLMFWSWLVDYASLKFNWVSRLIEPTPTLLIYNGQILHRNLRKEHLTLDDLTTQLRFNGIESATEVKRAYFEGDGEISVIPFK